MHAFKSLTDRLETIAKFIMRDKDPERASRNEWLDDYRKILNDPYTGEEFDEDSTKLTGRLFPYIHNELLANAATYVGPFARVTHITFGAVYQEKLDRRERDALKRTSKNMDKTLKHIWAYAIHPKDDNGPPADAPPSWKFWGPKAPHKTFRGGKGYIYEYVTNIFDFSEPFLTPKRHVEAIKKRLLKSADTGAITATEKLDNEIKKGGPSRRASDSVEFWLTHERANRLHVKWRRHNRHQTFTFTRDSGSTGDRNEPQPTFLMDEDWFPELLGGKEVAMTGDPFARTVLHDINDPEFFTNVLGRYIQGSNYIVLPVEAFLVRPLPAKNGAEAESGFDRLRRILAGKALTEREIDALQRCEARFRDGPFTGVRTPSLAPVIDAIQRDPERSLHFDQLVIEMTREFLPVCFQSSDFRSEFVAAKYMNGRAYAFSDLRNNRPESSQHVGGAGEHVDPLFTRGLIIDCGMNGLERGRLIQSMSEFATERSVALQWLPRFRLVHYALNFVQAHLSLAVANYHNGVNQCPSVIPTFYLSNRGISASGRLVGERGLIRAMEWLSSCLTLLNDVIEGGISDRSSVATNSNDFLHMKLNAIGESPLIGHQSPKEFIERRFLPPIRSIERTGERYRRLRQRVTEAVELANADLQTTQRDEQTRLLAVAEVFGLLAGAYYLSRLFIGGCAAVAQYGGEAQVDECGADNSLLIFLLALPICAAIIWLWKAMLTRRRQNARD